MISSKVKETGDITCFIFIIITFFYNDGLIYLAIYQITDKAISAFPLFWFIN